ncbi:MAG: YbaN family protein [Planctomycetota bacterium]
MERDDEAPAPSGLGAESERREEARQLAALRPAWERALWVVGGLVFVAVGAIGVVVPGLPTTPLLLLAAACFARSSPRLYAWLLRNKTFGPMIEDYRAGRGVSARVKATALSMMTIFVTFALLVPLRGKTVPSVVVAGFALAGAAYILRLPTRVPDR